MKTRPNPSQEGNGSRESGVGSRNPPLTPPRRGTGVGSWESGVGSWESGVGSWELGVGSRELGVGS
ncbi:MAG: hypothetical protein F6K56_39560 [Moorea sp. SIO3G5]|nr:hypothetical protein [Moorena sp. SIO3G5]